MTEVNWTNKGLRGEVNWIKELDEARKTLEFKTTSVSMDVTERVLEIMEEKEISFEDLAKKMKMGKRFLSQYFAHTEQMTINDLSRIAHCLDCGLKISFVDEA